MGQPALDAPTRTRWLVALILIGCGVIAAAHIGKVAPAIPALRDELGITEFMAGLMLASISVAAAVFAYPFGFVLRRFEPARVVTLALIWLGVLSIVGAFFTQPLLILAARAGESIGYLTVTLTVPALLRTVATVPDRRFVMALWATFMPLGSGLAVLFAPALLSTWGWQSLWVGSGLNCLIIAIVLMVLSPSLHSSRQPAGVVTEDPPGFRADLLRLASIFGLYAGIWLSVLGLLPTALVEAGTSLRFASIASGIAILVNVPGNIVAAGFAGKGMPVSRSVPIGALGIAVTTWGIYADHGSVPLIVASAMAFSFITGFIPASLFGALNRVGDPRRIPTATGALVQGSGVGQLLGPPALAGLLLASGGASLVGPAAITVGAVLIIVIAMFVRSDPAHDAPRTPRISRSRRAA
ncbi:MAG: MFS transporter [Intrasporangiaceae bacterium]|nr:MFS transporter [Intrasporangiaceae bacterium]